MYHSYLKLIFSFPIFSFIMALIGDCPVSLSNDFESSGSSPFVRIKTLLVSTQTFQLLLIMLLL